MNFFFFFNLKTKAKCSKPHKQFGIQASETESLENLNDPRQKSKTASLCIESHEGLCVCLMCVFLKLNAHSSVQHFKRLMFSLHQWFRITTQSWLKIIYFTFKKSYPFCITLPWAEGHSVLMDAMHTKWETLTKTDQ